MSDLLSMTPEIEGLGKGRREHPMGVVKPETLAAEVNTAFEARNASSAPEVKKIEGEVGRVLDKMAQGYIDNGVIDVSFSSLETQNLVKAGLATAVKGGGMASVTAEIEGENMTLKVGLPIVGTLEVELRGGAGGANVVGQPKVARGLKSIPGVNDFAQNPTEQINQLLMDQLELRGVNLAGEPELNVRDGRFSVHASKPEVPTAPTSAQAESTQPVSTAHPEPEIVLEPAVLPVITEVPRDVSQLVVPVAEVPVEPWITADDTWNNIRPASEEQAEPQPSTESPTRMEVAETASTSVVDMPNPQSRVADSAPLEPVVVISESQVEDKGKSVEYKLAIEKLKNYPDDAPVWGDIQGNLTRLAELQARDQAGLAGWEQEELAELLRSQKVMIDTKNALYAIAKDVDLLSGMSRQVRDVIDNQSDLSGVIDSIRASWPEEVVNNQAAMAFEVARQGIVLIDSTAEWKKAMARFDQDHPELAGKVRNIFGGGALFVYFEKQGVDEHRVAELTAKKAILGELNPGEAEELAVLGNELRLMQLGNHRVHPNTTQRAVQYAKAMVASGEWKRESTGGDEGGFNRNSGELTLPANPEAQRRLVRHLLDGIEDSRRDTTDLGNNLVSRALDVALKNMDSKVAEEVKTRLAIHDSHYLMEQAGGYLSRKDGMTISMAAGEAFRRKHDINGLTLKVLLKEGLPGLNTVKAWDLLQDAVFNYDTFVLEAGMTVEAGKNYYTDTNDDRKAAVRNLLIEKLGGGGAAVKSLELVEKFAIATLETSVWNRGGGFGNDELGEIMGLKEWREKRAGPGRSRGPEIHLPLIEGFGRPWLRKLNPEKSLDEPLYARDIKTEGIALGSWKNHCAVTLTRTNELKGLLLDENPAPNKITISTLKSIVHHFNEVDKDKKLGLRKLWLLGVVYMAANQPELQWDIDSFKALRKAATQERLSDEAGSFISRAEWDEIVRKTNAIHKIAKAGAAKIFTK